MSSRQMPVLSVVQGRLAAAEPWPPVTGVGASLGFTLLLAGIAAVGVWLYAGGHNLNAFLWLNDAGRLLPAWLWQWVTFLGNTHAVWVLALLFVPRAPQLLWIGLFAAAVATVITYGLKLWIDAPRPPVLLSADAFRLIGPERTEHALPSGHTAAFWTLAAALLPFMTRGWSVALLLGAAALVGLSRIMVGVHWPLDVALGAFCGVLAGWAGLVIGYLLRDALRAWVQLVLLLASLIAAAALFWHDTAYPAAGPVARVLAAAAIATMLAVYAWPVFSRRFAGPPQYR